MKLPTTYTINVRHRFDFTESPEQLYDRAYAVLSTLAQPWGLCEIAKKSLPPIKSNAMTGVSYTREVGRPVSNYTLGFQNRSRTKAPADLQRYDDLLLVVIRGKQLTPELFSTLLREAMPKYIQAMSPYWMALEEDALALEDSRTKFPDGSSGPRSDFVNLRVGVQRIWPVNYWDRILCERAFDLKPEEVAQRLNSHVDEVRLINDGVLIIDSFDFPTDEATRRVHDRLRSRLQPK